jgi:multidrug efflux pump subunit AcrA (membrane-fusion protein)
LIPKRLIRPLFALLAVAVLTGCALLPEVEIDRSTDGQPTPTPIPTAIIPIRPTYTVQRGDVVDELEFSARISPVIEEELFFRSGGRVESVFQRRNDIVEAGTIIATLEIEGLQRAMEAAELALERAEMRLEQAQETLDYEIRVAETNLEIAQIRLDSLRSETFPDNTAIAIQEKQIELAELALARLRSGVDPLLVSDVTSAQQTVNRLLAEIAETQVIAPFDGQILSLSLTPGQQVDAYRPVVNFADISHLEAKADLISTQMDRLAEGMQTQVTLVNRPGVNLSGEVRQLPYPYGSGGRGTTIDDLDRSTRVTIFESPTDAGFNLGDLVRITVVLQEKDEVLWLPPQALRVFDGRRFALVQDEDAQRRVDVTVGIQTPDRVEILDGLEEGQTVVGP